MREAGSTSGIVLGMLLFISALFLGAGIFVEQAFSGLRRGEERRREERLLADEAGRVVRLLLEDPTPFADSPRDPVWQQIHSAQAEGVSVRLEETSSFLGLNWVRKELLQEMGVLRPEKTPQELQQFREDTGLHLDLKAAYAEYVEEGPIETLFTAYNYYNVNICDEFVLRKLCFLRSADREEAEVFHTAIQKARTEQKTIERETLRDFLGEDRYRLLFPVLNAEPPINVHFAPEGVLRALFAHYEVPAEKAESIVWLRPTEEWSEEDLEDLIGNRYAQTLLRHYLGTRSWFWRIRVRGPRSQLTWTVARVPGAEIPAGGGEEGAEEGPVEYPVVEGEAAELRVVEESLSP